MLTKFLVVINWRPSEKIFRIFYGIEARNFHSWFTYFPKKMFKTIVSLILLMLLQMCAQPKKPITLTPNTPSMENTTNSTNLANITAQCVAITSSVRMPNFHPLAAGPVFLKPTKKGPPITVTPNTAWSASKLYANVAILTLATFSTTVHHQPERDIAWILWAWNLWEIRRRNKKNCETGVSQFLVFFI